MAVGAMRRFDPRLIGRLECAAWMAYYRREWGRAAVAFVRLTRNAFGLPWPHTLYGAFLVLRANQLWAPHPVNDPDGARRCMRRFYALVARRSREAFDPAEAARLEVEWWAVHRHRQREAPGGPADPLVEALARLSAHVYGVTAEDGRPAARERALAMDLSDRWVAEGCVPESPLVEQERAALVRAYALLLGAVYR